MIAFLLPKSEHNFEQRFTLGGSDYVIRFLWNGRVRRWYWSMADVEGNDLTGQRKLVPDWNIWQDIPSGSLPGGQFWAITSNGRDPGVLDLTGDFGLAYLHADEVPS